MNTSMANDQRTRVAVLGTLAEFHGGAIPFDMSSLLELVASINPDLLCLDITPRQWRARDFEKLPLDYRDVLLPLAYQTDIVVAPIGGEINSAGEVTAEMQLRAVHRLRKWIGLIQRTAPGPAAMNQGWRHDLANALYYAIWRLTSSDKRGEARAHADDLTKQLLVVSRRDPGARVLAVVNVQYCHLIRGRLLQFDEIEVTGFSEL